ncbi:putative fluoride ion transporter CrcB 1 [Effusibacillus dendaii]|uniref:Fluoride-specific ion channel FluC n=1 Tax=Effusibacillus dendaii TaxID=2743772 RepID=A0A7I8D5U3_9BACL|nr:putative fluoride ion transporter CrcB 1 [Effusibacillus dendaii]
MPYLIVGVGGILGALLRYLLGLYVHFWWQSPFPLGTLLTNLIGCVALAWITTRLLKPGSFQTWIRLGFGTGLIGSFTTFSTFSLETVELLKRDLWGVALLYVLLSLWGGLLMAWVGCRIARSQLQKRAKEAESA